MYTLETNGFEIDGEKIGKSLDYFIKRINLDGNFSVTFVSDEEIEELNREYREKDEPTDILTFALSDGDEFPNPEGEKELGDVFISLESMRRNAREFEVPDDEELERLLLHGLLHLLGMDHKSNDFSSEEMLLLQEKILREKRGEGL